MTNKEAPPTDADDSYYLSGYLDKRKKDGEWQKRFFETNGPFITYYKSKRKTKLLAAVRLTDASEITVLDKVPTEIDPEGIGNIFCLILHGRSYHIRANDRAEACKWVEVLTDLRAKELEVFQEGEGTDLHDYQAQQGISREENQALCFGLACCGRGDTI
eukprot:CAMPEP_0194564426 /NCGR_PEP_ID=MMETSP0292-20121207/4089_1 /TAXON_ID=39354 /ORGANISM="Heterosigma akashiwo, Strain CCMP2393" /LENGTH=159 /DNA_ID=CAMNT_0039413559 /DNA_START=38 /DNA_END=517 /DNA_ORIENTATION=-